MSTDGGSRTARRPARLRNRSMTGDAAAVNRAAPPPSAVRPAAGQQSIGMFSCHDPNWMSGWCLPPLLACCSPGATRPRQEESTAPANRCRAAAFSRLQHFLLPFPSPALPRCASTAAARKKATTGKRRFVRPASQRRAGRCQARCAPKRKSSSPWALQFAPPPAVFRPAIRRGL